MNKFKEKSNITDKDFKCGKHGHKPGDHKCPENKVKKMNEIIKQKI